MKIKPYAKALEELVAKAEKNTNYELEVLIKNYQNNVITQDKFFNVLKRLNSESHIMFSNEEEYLDIIVDSVRFTIVGNNNIIKYCQSEDIKSINPKYIHIVQKTNINKIDINDYKIRFNLKNEITLDRKTKIVSDILKEWKTTYKIFRYKKRISFLTHDNMFQYDMTMIKSNKVSEKGPNTTMKKRDIPNYKKKYVAKPFHIKNFNQWFNKFNDNDDVPMIGKSFDKLVHYKSVKQSKVFDNDLEYEIEIEYIGNKLQGKKPSPKTILLNMIQNLIIVLQAYHKTYYIISDNEKNDVITQYNTLMNSYRFSAPMNVTLEKKHMIERSYVDYNNLVSIRKEYSVTDKADGERNLLIILQNGQMYLLNRKNDIKYLGASCIELGGSILDSEYILHDKHNNNINLLMLFDAYFYKGTDIRNRILQRSQEEIIENKIKESRLEISQEIYDILQTKLKLESNNNLRIHLKQFLFGDDDIYTKETEMYIDNQQKELIKYSEDEQEYTDILESISIHKSDQKIFECCSNLYSKEYEYKIDGLIFTPRNLFAGEEPGTKPKFNGRWYRSFKWKPPEENTIDFVVEIMKDPNNITKDLIKNNSSGSYKTLILKIGYDPEKHNVYNSMRVLNENIVYVKEFTSIEFFPADPYSKDACYAPILLEDDNIYTLDDKMIIKDGMIIECKYNIDESGIFKWSPMRVRDNLTPNDYITANNVWNCIHNPVTLDMITTGKSESDNNEFDIYYNNNTKRRERQCTPMYDFHSYVKKKLITDNISGNNNLLDTSVGKGGDLNHWISANVNMVVGIDVCKYGLVEPSGTCNRILKKSIDLNDIHFAENSLIIWADTSKNIMKDGGLDLLNKYYLDIIYGNKLFENIENSKLKKFHNLGNVSEGGGFDMVSCQFSIHYYFENSTILNTYLSNVSNSLKSGGIFIGTCLNGTKVFNLLKTNDTIRNEGEYTCWKITKKYTNKKFSVNENSLGLEIDVFNESIGISIKEYLVNMDYLIFMCDKYKLRIKEVDSFETKYSNMGSEKYGTVDKMTDDMKKYSFLNNYFIFEKI
jgi:hypothetical protein